MRAQATTCRAWTSKPAHRAYSSCIAPPPRAQPAWSPRRRNLQVVLTGETPGPHFRVLAGLRVTLTSGLDGTTRRPTSLLACVAQCTLFHASECVADTWGTHLIGYGSGSRFWVQVGFLVPCSFQVPRRLNGSWFLGSEFQVRRR